MEWLKVHNRDIRLRESKNNKNTTEKDKKMYSSYGQGDITGFQSFVWRYVIKK